MIICCRQCSRACIAHEQLKATLNCKLTFSDCETTEINVIHDNIAANEKNSMFVKIYFSF